jgi:hypothetical protein
MRFQVRFQYNEQTGEVELFEVDAAPEGGRSGDHDRVHDQVSAELAGLLEVDAEIVEQRPGPLGTERTRHDSRSDSDQQPQTLPPEEMGG